jgi:tryptophan-rich sensory protein
MLRALLLYANTMTFKTKIRLLLFMYVTIYINNTTKSTSYVVSRVTLLGPVFGLFLRIIIIIIIIIIINCKDDSA